MRIGLWNIDHPELHLNVTDGSRRYRAISTYLNRQRCDVYILTEANAAIELARYRSQFSVESPFRTKRRCYKEPNRYHQVGIYSTYSLSKVEIDEPINGLLCSSGLTEKPLFIYGNVVTIKDRWAENRTKAYADRLSEQLEILEKLATKRCIVGGDFNLKLGWANKKHSHQRLKQHVWEHGWIWPTETRTDTVQHVIHSPEVRTSITLDSSVKADGLSDHPFVMIDMTEG